MQKAEILLLLDYNAWANGRVLDLVAKVSAERLIATPNSHVMSLWDTLVHMLGAELLWRTRMQFGVSPAPLHATNVPTLEALREGWHEEERAMRAYLAMLDDVGLDGAFRYRRSSGQMSDELTRWHTLVHLVNHGTQHRSEAAYLLSVAGHSPGDLDFGWFLNDRR